MTTNLSYLNRVMSVDKFRRQFLWSFASVLKSNEQINFFLQKNSMREQIEVHYTKTLLERAGYKVTNMP